MIIMESGQGWLGCCGDLLCDDGHSPDSCECAMMWTGGSSETLEGIATTAPAGVTPPSDVGGNSSASAGVTIDMLLVKPLVTA